MHSTPSRTGYIPEQKSDQSVKSWNQGHDSNPSGEEGGLAPLLFEGGINIYCNSCLLLLSCVCTSMYLIE